MVNIPDFGYVVGELIEKYQLKLIVKPQRKSISPRTRFLILKRDNFRCQMCGATAQDGTRLEIDHKVPVSDGGTDDEGNLWTTCFECNRGKAADTLSFG